VKYQGRGKKGELNRELGTFASNSRPGPNEVRDRVKSLEALVRFPV